MNWKKEAIDQPLHALWSGVSIFAAIVGWSAGWPIGVSVALTTAGSASLIGLCVREWAQKKDKGGILDNWPWTDTVGYTAGLIIGGALGIWL